MTGGAGMPKIYRGMKQEQGKPALGAAATTLGARVPNDIEADAGGLVHPGTGGMSVAPSLQNLPNFRVPKRLHSIFPAAQGRNELFVWSMGIGVFRDGPLTESLNLRLDPTDPRHGFVEPAVTMSLNDYQNALWATQSEWSIDEE